MGMNVSKHKRSVISNMFYSFMLTSVPEGARTSRVRSGARPINKGKNIHLTSKLRDQSFKLPQLLWISTHLLHQSLVHETATRVSVCGGVTSTLTQDLNNQHGRKTKHLYQIQGGRGRKTRK